jgi:hypothetical protein
VNVEELQFGVDLFVFAKRTNDGCYHVLVILSEVVLLTSVIIYVDN